MEIRLYLGCLSYLICGSNTCSTSANLFPSELLQLHSGAVYRFATSMVLAPLSPWQVVLSTKDLGSSACEENAMLLVALKKRDVLQPGHSLHETVNKSVHGLPTVILLDPDSWYTNRSIDKV